jgi:hypothetical protein
MICNQKGIIRNENKISKMGCSQEGTIMNEKHPQGGHYNKKWTIKIQNTIKKTSFAKKKITKS